MKRVINRLVYDTDSAERVHEYDNGLSRSDFKSYSEALYKTAAGRWFIAGEGGPMTHYARSAGDNSTTGGEGLRVVLPDEALEWLESHDASPETISAHFATEPA